MKWAVSGNFADQTSDNSYTAVLLMAWGLLRAAVSRAGGGAAAAGAGPVAAPIELLNAAGKHGALAVLASILKGTSFKMEVEEEHKQLCAMTVYRLITELLVFDNMERR